MNAKIVLSTVPAENVVELSEALLNARLVACVNEIAGVKSRYWWKGQIQTESESLLLMKTDIEFVEDLKHKINELHPYDVPEVVVLDIEDGLEAYLNWISEETQVHKVNTGGEDNDE